MEIVDHIPMKRIDGFPTSLFGFSEKNFRGVFAMKPRDDDLFINTFPKCGTTWTQFIVWELMHDGAVPPRSFETMLLKEIPFLEMTGTDEIESIPSPRAFKLHLPYRLTPKSTKAKYIIIARNPFDACVSYFNHLNQLDVKILNMTVRFEPYVEDFVIGEVPSGSYFEHVQSWYDHKDDPNVLYLFFEDMKKDHKGSILKIAEFMGESYLQKLKDDPELLERVIKHTTFEFMKQNVEVRMEAHPDLIKEMKEEFGRDPHPDKGNWDVNFFREGAVGGSKVVLSEEQWKLIDNALDEQIKDPELRDKLRKTSLKK